MPVYCGAVACPVVAISGGSCQCGSSEFRKCRSIRFRSNRANTTGFCTELVLFALIVGDAEMVVCVVVVVFFVFCFFCFFGVVIGLCVEDSNVMCFVCLCDRFVFMDDYDVCEQTDAAELAVGSHGDDRHAVLYLAGAEDSKDSVQDGPVAGSVIGLAVCAFDEGHVVTHCDTRYTPLVVCCVDGVGFT
jgi:hypothetical protein